MDKNSIKIGDIVTMPEWALDGLKLNISLYLIYKGDDMTMYLDEPDELIGVFTAYDDAKKYIDGKISEYDENMAIMGGNLRKIGRIWETYYKTKRMYEDGIKRPGSLEGFSVEEFDRLTITRDFLYNKVFGSYTIKKTETGVPMVDKKVYKAILDETDKRIEEYDE